MSITAQEFKDIIQKKRHSKYKSKTTIVDGISFQSKLEAQYYQKLKIRQQAGDIKYFLRQIPIRLPGKISYWCDFMIVENDGSIRYVDTKGFETSEFKLKKKQVEALYPITIEVITK
jgi:hypothetical protein